MAIPELEMEEYEYIKSQEEVAAVNIGPQANPQFIERFTKLHEEIGLH